MPFIWFWPDGANGCAILTHDVEAEPGRDFCETLMDLDDEYGIKASFQLVPEKPLRHASGALSKASGAAASR